MNIHEAKEEIIRTLRAYTRRNPDGSHRIPVEKQRPMLLIGPPGIGKTAIMHQIARETGVGLVAYAMTHHTRQSAIGLPLITQKEYGGHTYSVTEYTMSEIVASIYDTMAATGKKSGILFLDEINCVSETLAPVMLQLLQNKTFGTHALPEDWIIVAAGNPPEYNKSVREMDMATLDRVKNMDISADLGVWQEYARKNGVHPAVRTYLSAYPEHFYNITDTERGQLFVTARGWEDLSCILQSYEEDGEPVDDEFFRQYLQHDEIAHSFAMYYDLFRSFDGGELGLTEAMKRRSERLSGLTATECMALAAILFHSIQSGAAARADALSRLARLEELVRLIPADCDMSNEEQKLRWFRQNRDALSVRAAHKVIPPEEEFRERDVLSRLEKDVADWLKEDRSSLFPEYERAVIQRRRNEWEQRSGDILGQVEDAYAVLELCPQGRSALLYLTTDLGGDPSVGELLEAHPCETWMRYNQELLAEV